MNPIQMFVRGYKTAVSNLGLAWIYLGAVLLLVVLMVLPLVLVLVAIGGGVLTKEPNWTLWIGIFLLLSGWLTLLFVAYFYVEGGIRGLVVRAHRSAPADYALQPKLGASAAFKIFTFDGFVEEMKRHGWRVTVVASLYGFVASLLLIPCMIPLIVAIPYMIADELGPMVWTMMALFFVLFLLTVVAVLALVLHYQVAVTVAVVRAAGWRESVREATRLIRAKPLELLAVFGLSLAAGMCVGTVFAMVSLPLAFLSIVPGVILIVLPIRLVLVACQWFVQGILQTAMIGAYTAYCEELPGAPASAPASVSEEAPAPPSPPEPAALIDPA